MLYKRPGSPYWWVRFSVGGRRVRRSTETASRKQATEFEARLREREWGRAHAGERTWQEACTRWLEDHQHKRSLARDQIIIEWTLPRLSDALLADLDRERLDLLRKEKAAETSPATANRYLALLRSILNAAVTWGWLPVAPKVPMYPRESGDYQWLTRAEFAKLLPHLPAHTRQLARFAVATGLRRTNITHLRWSQIHGDAVHLRGRETKGGKALAVPLNGDALAVIAEQKKAEKRHDVWVFPYQGHPVYQVSTKAWRDAVKAIGRKGLRFHDLRHTWASWHVQAGTPLNALQVLGGWADLQMVNRYGHLDSQSLSDHAQAVSVSGHKSGTRNRKKPRKAA